MYHQNRTKTFAQLTFAEQAKSISAQIVVLHAASERTYVEKHKNDDQFQPFEENVNGRSSIYWPDYKSDVGA
jgi:hypothetical protein